MSKEPEDLRDGYASLTDPDDSAFSSDSECGLSKREYIATMAMQGMLADESGQQGATWNPKACAKRSVEFAEALIFALNQNKE